MKADLSQRAAVPRRVSVVTAGSCGAPEHGKRKPPAEAGGGVLFGCTRIWGTCRDKGMEISGTVIVNRKLL